ncbi:MAG: hypothetical protein R2939_10355 [Kofleriaceae bacterium]
MLVGLLGLAACDGWPDLEPSSTDTPLDPDLGVELARTPRSFRVASGFDGGGRLLVLYEDRGAGWSLLRVDPDSGASERLTPPPLAVGDTVAPIRAIEPDAIGYVVIHDGVATPWLRDGGSWRALPPVPTGEGPVDIGAALAHDGRVYVAEGTTAWMWTGDAWIEPVGSSARVVLGGFDATTQWMVTARDEDGALAAYPVSPAGVAGAPVLGPAVGPPVGGALNGSASSFQLVAGGAVYVVTPTAITAGDGVSGTLWSTPGSATTLVSTESDTSSPWTFVVGGAVGEVAVPTVSPMVDCPTCTPHQVNFYQARPSGDASRLALVMVDADDGYAVMTVRFFDLPLAVDPFAS